MHVGRDGSLFLEPLEHGPVEIPVVADPGRPAMVAHGNLSRWTDAGPHAVTHRHQVRLEARVVAVGPHARVPRPSRWRCRRSRNRRRRCRRMRQPQASGVMMFGSGIMPARAVSGRILSDSARARRPCGTPASRGPGPVLDHFHPAGLGGRNEDVGGEHAVDVLRPPVGRGVGGQLHRLVVVGRNGSPGLVLRVL
jgi:hypothetical protein